MAHDPELADRIRELLGLEAGVTEQRMFGGLAFLVDGHLAVAASGQGGILVRCDPPAAERLLATTPAEPMETKGRPMRGWLRVAPEHLRTKRQLARWVAMGTASARSLGPKRPAGARR